MDRASPFSEEKSTARVRSNSEIAFDKGFNVLKFARHGPMIYNENDAYVGRSFALYGEYNQEECALLLDLIEAHTFVIEVGANIGSHTIPLAQKAAIVFAFEPQRLVYQMLLGNVALNQLTNVQAWQAAVSTVVESGKPLFMPELDPRKPYNFGGVSMQDTPTSEAAMVISLDGLNIPQCGLLKVDVEGMELKVLQGAEKLIDRCRPYIYVENDRAEHSAALIAHLQAMGYTLYWHLPPLFNPENFAKVTENVFPGIVSVNMLCVPRADAPSFGLRKVEGPADSWK